LNSIHRVPPNLVDHVEAWAAAGRPPVAARGAATVVLLRSGPTGEHSRGPEVYLLRRHSEMAFAAGMYAFPGGSVDPRDSDGSVAWSGPSPADWAVLFGSDEAVARALVCAAMRETFEESGVLLAGATGDTVVADTTGADWESDRAALVDRSLAFSDFLDQRGLVLRTDLLAYWAHWITPEFEPRRFDTRFFLAVMPEGQHTRDVSGEADRVVWMRPADAVAGVDDGSMAMLPPTYVTVREMAAYATAADALAASRDRVVQTIMPSVEVVDGVALFVGTGDD
jgi:8-oxo-dGTP pyrophosphatase MutT (NUDIX family)